MNGENKLYYGVIVRRALERECEVTACLKTYLLGAPGASTKSTLGADLLSAALDSRTVDAYASDRVILIGMGRMSKNPEKLALIDEFFSYEPHGFMLRRGDAAFRLSVNRALAAMYRSGEVAPIFEKAFGSMTTAAPIILNMYLINGLPE